jgi:large conductance mechanosensitive channel
MAVRDSIKGFRDFILRGNVVDLAVAVVIATAFGVVIKSINDNLITGVLAMIAGKPNFRDVGVLTIHHGQILFGAIFTDILNFVITAAVVYFVVVVPVNKLMARFAAGEISEAAPDPQLVLLGEIRDLLATKA